MHHSENNATIHAMTLSQEDLERYGECLAQREKSRATLDKYVRDVRRFFVYLGEDLRLTKERVLQYKAHLEQYYRLGSANSMLIALHSFLEFIGREDCRVKLFKVQRRMFLPEDKELHAEEYKRLVAAARSAGKERIALIMETVGCTGMRVSELTFVTVEALQNGKIMVNNKGKCREVCLIPALRKKLLRFCKKRGLVSGCVFVSRTGKPLHRSQIWKEMKKLSAQAGVRPPKVFPHNLRHMFARAYYKKYRNIGYLADILGHSSVDTTRIYTATSGAVHRRMLEGLGLVS